MNGTKVQIRPANTPRVTSGWAVALSWFGFLVGVPLVWYYVARIGPSQSWDDVWAVTTTVLAVVQLGAVHLHRWTTAVVALSLLAVPPAVFVVGLWWLFGLGIMGLPALIVWAPAFVAALDAQRRTEQSAGGPTREQAVRRAVAWAWVAPLGGTAATLIVLQNMWQAGPNPWWWLWGTVVAALVAGTVVSLRQLLLVRSGDWQRAGGSSSAAMSVWLVVGALGIFVFVSPVLLLAFAARRSGRYAELIAEHDAAAGQAQLAGTSQT